MALHCFVNDAVDVAKTYSTPEKSLHGHFIRPIKHHRHRTTFAYRSIGKLKSRIALVIYR
jgi:hypothetical protein